MSFRAWGPKNFPILGLAGAVTQTTHTAVPGFKTGGQTMVIVNRDTTAYAIVGFWNSVRTGTPPTLAFPADGALSAFTKGGVTQCVVPPNSRISVSVPIDVDSVGSIATAAMTNAMLLQRGDGNT